MKVVKPQQLGILTRPFEYLGACYLGVSVLAAVRMSNTLDLLLEADLWQEALPLLDGHALDAGIPKRGGEFIVVGSAYSPDETATASMRVGINVGELTKELWVFGDRFIEGTVISEPVPFSCMPLTWEKAFGGDGFSPNPLGKGFSPTVNDRGEKRLWLPNVEHPERLYRLNGQRPEPASFGPIDTTWPQRQRFAGTYDKNWLKTEFPGFAKDIQWEHFNLTSRDQWVSQAFSGDETFRLYGMHAGSSVIEGRLPNLRSRCFYLRQDATQLEESPCTLTTLWFLPDIDLIILIYHSSIKVQDDDARDIRSIMVAAEHAERSRDVSHYEQTYKKRVDPEGEVMELVLDQPLVPEGMAKSIIQPLLDDYAKKAESPFARNMKSMAADSFETLRAKTEEAGMDLPDNAMPDLSAEPFPELDKIESFMEEKLQQLDDIQSETETKRKAARLEALERIKSLPDGSIDPKDAEKMMDEADKSSGSSGPPKFSAQKQREQLREQIRRIRSGGGNATLLEQEFDTEEQFQMWSEAESGLNDLYRETAHFQEPVKQAENSDALRKKLFAMLEAGASLSDKDFSGIDLSGADLRDRNLSGIFMESAVLDGANLSGASLDRAVLAHCSMRGTTLDEANLEKANLGKARLQDVSAIKCLFEESVLQLARLENCDFSGARMSGMQLFLNAEFVNCTFSGAEIEDLFVNEASMANTDFTSAKLVAPVFLKATLDGANFADAFMEESVFVDCSVMGASFSGARLGGSCFVEQCRLSDCDFSGADLFRVNLRGTILHRCCFDGSNLREADLSEIEAGGASFKSTSASQSRWVRSDLRDADLSGALLVGAVMHKADIRGTDMRANLYRADLARVHVERSTEFTGAFTAKLNTYPRKFPAKANTDD